jgi:hypothetical protein
MAETATTMNLDIEIKFIERFVNKTKKDRYLTFLKSNKTRSKFTQELAHFKDLKQELFEEVTGNEYKIIKDKIKSLKNIKDCYLISESSQLDQKRLDIDTALKETIGQGMGTLIIFGDAEIVFYEAEGPKDRWISKQVKK